MLRTFYFSLLLAAFSAGGVDLPGVVRYSARVWQTDDGLPQNIVHAIHQTRDGYLWLGTREGVARFDGVRFSNFNSKNTPMLKGKLIMSICQTRDEALWIATEDEGLSRLKDGKWSHLGLAEGLPSLQLKNLFEARDGSLWISTLAGVARYQKDRFTIFTSKDGLSSDSVREIREDEEGNFWFATHEGLNCFKGGDIAPTNIVTSFDQTDGLFDSSIRAFGKDRHGNLWIGSNGGLAKIRDGLLEQRFNKLNGLPDNIVTVIHEDRMGTLWIGTYGGLCWWNGTGFVTELNPNGEVYDLVNAITEDREGNIWVGAKDGLYRLNHRRFAAITKLHGLTHNNIMSLRETKNGGLVVATWGGGVNLIRDGKISACDPSHFFSDQVLSLCEARDSSVWVGMDYGDGIYQLKDGVVAQHLAFGEGLTDPAVSVIVEDRAGNFWLGTRTALVKFSDGKFTRYTMQDGLAGEMVRAIYEDGEGTLWIGTNKGLSRWRNGNLENFTTKNGLPSNSISSIYEDADHAFWIGTRGGGLALWKNEQFTSFSTEHGLFDDNVFDVVEDDAGYFWMTCLKGISRIRKKDLQDFAAGKIPRLTCFTYGKADGMVSVQCNGVAKPAVWKNEKGHLYFATTKGFVTTNPREETTANTVPPPVVIESVIADQQQVTGNTVDHDTRHLPLVTIQPGHGELEIVYTALSFRAPEKVQFKYKLEGVDRDWIEAATRRSARYNNIYPGHYRFRVKACNNDGVWNETGAEVAFVWLPHFWQTWWFTACAIAVSAGSVAGIVRYVTRKKMQRKMANLEQQNAIEKERARIAKDIHDDLGSSLTRITLLGELTEEDKARPEEVAVHAQKIVASARETVRSLDEIVWAINPRNDTLNSLVQYISHYADEFFENTNVACRLEIPVELPDLLLPSEARHSLFLVVKESLNNILKHAEATEVTVRISETDSLLKMEIIDNGRGFDPNQLPNGRRGNGLSNMRKRIEDLGGFYCLESAAGKGTRMRVEVKVKSSG